MPLIHLQRLALRPVARAPAAQWLAFRRLHGSHSCRLQASQRAQQTQQRLFDALFPNQPKNPSKQPRSSKADPTASDNSAPTRPAPRWASQISDELPPLAPSEELRKLSELPEPDDDDADFLDGTQSGPRQASRRNNSDTAALRATTMLILNAASKQLVESDFMRIGAKGKHLPGWVNGIVKVIQGRDHATLEPLGHYFILFDRHEAAVAYSEEVQRLRDLARKYTPGASHGLKHAQRRHSLPQGLPTDTGEDVATLIKSFTLVSPSHRPRLQISRLSRDRIGELDRGGPLVDDISAAVGGFRHLVMVHVADGGRMSVDALQQAIRADGIERNLPWRVVSLNTGIIPFGKSVLKPRDDTPPHRNDTASQHTASTPNSPPDESEKVPDGDGEDITDHTHEDNDNDTIFINNNSPTDSNDPYPSTTTTNNNNRERQYPRFLVAFADDAEARRFVRHWHRRELTPLLANPAASAANGPGLPPQKRSAPALWEHARIVNVSLLW
ncbi:uncharacterized protein B0I36DRAFT_318608 [Microdochium trichocladiopsis]|uniref:Uncharacterized protein n=1 Tax=Microdochium trichocladiopsis TaxID=1682393 RepID=A0A9P8YEJ2_9PEZI|nr:uncharacterized protein B0I36DRAFT_318608 [Microdochium trichocladiopsis]KAH7035568.1 hypothetical protein B0I36DRAFT_318608 [Microdochium trichocladiopsis]